MDDLDAISTLGFRGEALPSIASVATVTMITCTPDSDIGTRYVLDNGTETDFGEIGAPVGTTVTVEDLFARIPARRKFLQKDSTEENAITACVAKFILANPNVSFEYVANDKTLYFSDGNGVESAIITIYGKEYLANTSYVQSNISDIVLCGYINKPAYTKHSRLYQTLVVNGRYVQSDEISFTIFGCYQKYLMKRQYPTYVLYLNLPCDLVDVNVHPSKTEVRFATVGIIKKLIADTVKEQVLSEVSIPKEIGGSPRDEELFKFFTSKQQPAGGTTTSQETNMATIRMFSPTIFPKFYLATIPQTIKTTPFKMVLTTFSPITHGPLADEIAEPTPRKKIDSSFLDLPPIETRSQRR
ncbi:MAG: DNA mismatch repair endonuclease MutL [Christensenellales bacterium]